VGHCNPRVVEAIHRQASTLNTHTRYVHEGVLDYIERLSATMHDGLTTAVMTCTGSEANDIALRMAEAVTGKRGIIATDATYHGNTALVSQLSRSNVPQTGFGLDQYFRHVKAPDSYRNVDPDGTVFAGLVAEKITELEKSAHGFAAFIVCPYFLNEGFPSQVEGWLKPAAEVVHNAGGLLICDEVQSGFKFRNSFRYFNTFGGNPVSCAAAMAVLDELQEYKLQSNAQVVGDYSLKRLQTLQLKYEGIAKNLQANLQMLLLMQCAIEE